MSVNYATGLSKHVYKGKCGQPEIHDEEQILQQKIQDFIHIFEEVRFVYIILYQNLELFILF